MLPKLYKAILITPPVFEEFFWRTLERDKVSKRRLGVAGRLSVSFHLSQFHAGILGGNDCLDHRWKISPGYFLW